MSKDESTLASTFRQLAGLPPRKNDKPHDPAKPSELARPTEPEGGYGNPEGEKPAAKKAPAKAEEKKVEAPQ